MRFVKYEVTVDKSARVLFDADNGVWTEFYGRVALAWYEPHEDCSGHEWLYKSIGPFDTESEFTSTLQYWVDRFNNIGKDAMQRAEDLENRGYDVAIVSDDDC